MKTAVEWLESEMLENYSPFDNKLLYEAIHKAKEIEKEKLIDFHIEVMKKGLEYENEKEWSDEYLPLIKERAEQYYNETFKKQEQ
jgi:hypothetical protein